jgi:hypothetical protein
MKHKNKYTFLLNWLEKEPLKYSDMNRLLKSVVLHNDGFYKIAKEFKGDKWRDRKDYQGYGNTNLVLLKFGASSYDCDKPLIEKGTDGKYKLTAYGLKSKETPFKRTKESLKLEKEYWKKRKSFYNNSYVKMYAPIKERVIFEDDNFKVIQKITKGY